MRRAAVLFAVLGLLSAARPFETGGFGVGAIVGEPTGLSLKAWLGRTLAVDASAAWSMYDPIAMQLHADLLRHFPDVIEPSFGLLPLYYGIGGRVRLPHGVDDALVGVRVPFGFEYLFDSIPVGISVEVAPVLDFVPAVRPAVNGSVIFRFYFR